MSEHNGSSSVDYEEWLSSSANWGRWGSDDQLGALNLITKQKRLEAFGLVQHGRSVGLGHVLDPQTGGVSLEAFTDDRGSGAVATLDKLSLSAHGLSVTHIDALCHIWLDSLMWNGRPGGPYFGSEGSHWADVEQMRDGIITRGVVLDVADTRSDGYVEVDEPVTGSELEGILKDQGRVITAGDALLVHAGKARRDKEMSGASPGVNDDRRPGFHASVMEFLRDNDVSVLLWDMLDETPSRMSIPWAVHGVIPLLGIPLVDNLDFGRLLPVCRELNQWEVLLMISPLRIAGGTGSAVNPLAVF